jgi:hypothetical protein
VDECSRRPTRNSPSSPRPPAATLSTCAASDPRVLRASCQTHRVLHMMATVQLRHATEDRAYFDRRSARRQELDRGNALPRTTALRHRLPHHARRADPEHGVGPGGQRGHDSDSGVTGSHPSDGSSDKDSPGPAETRTRTSLPTASQKGAMTALSLFAAGDEGITAGCTWTVRRSSGCLNLSPCRSRGAGISWVLGGTVASG